MKHFVIALSVCTVILIVISFFLPARRSPATVRVSATSRAPSSFPEPTVFSKTVDYGTEVKRILRRTSADINAVSGDANGTAKTELRKFRSSINSAVNEMDRLTPPSIAKDLHKETLSVFRKCVKSIDSLSASASDTDRALTMTICAIEISEIGG